jgi:hypothetical protein
MDDFHAGLLGADVNGIRAIVKPVGERIFPTRPFPSPEPFFLTASAAA